MGKRKGRKYTAAERKAYYIGIGERCAKTGKHGNFRNEGEMKSYRAGYAAADKVIRNAPESDSPLIFIDSVLKMSKRKKTVKPLKEKSAKKGLSNEEVCRRNAE